jgi:hypothetical protein
MARCLAMAARTGTRDNPPARSAFRPCRTKDRTLSAVVGSRQISCGAGPGSCHQAPDSDRRAASDHVAAPEPPPEISGTRDVGTRTAIRSAGASPCRTRCNTCRTARPSSPCTYTTDVRTSEYRPWRPSTRSLRLFTSTSRHDFKTHCAAVATDSVACRTSAVISSNPKGFSSTPRTPRARAPWRTSGVP